MGEKGSVRGSTLTEKRYVSLACNQTLYVFLGFLELLLQYRVVFHISQVSHQVRSSQYLLPQGMMFR